MGALAHFVRQKRHGLKAHYVVNRHLNYSNVCVGTCRFCAFRKAEGEEGAYTLDLGRAEEIVLTEAPADVAEIHVVGGCHPSLRLEWFTTLLRRVKELRPAAVLKCFTAAEIAHLAELEGMTTTAVLAALKAVGVESLAGGGAEIFTPAVRSRICPDKISGERWLAIHGEAHALGLSSNATMLYGHVESVRDRLEHLDALRRQQDASGGFVCFIPLAYQPRNNPLAAGAGPTGLDDLRTLAVSRLMLDNIPHLKAYWVMLGLKAAQAALWFGADDLDGTIVEERIGKSAGADSETTLTAVEMERMIEGCGLTPVRRDGLFRPVGTPTAAPAACGDGGLRALLAEVAAGRRLDAEAALLLYERAEFHDLGRLAHAVRLARHPEPAVTYIVDRNVNYTNVCVCGCRFCAFYQGPGGRRGAIVLTPEELSRKVEETHRAGRPPDPAPGRPPPRPAALLLRDHAAPT